MDLVPRLNLEVYPAFAELLDDRIVEVRQLQMGVFLHPEALSEALLKEDDHLNIFSCYLFDRLTVSEHGHQLVRSRKQCVEKEGHRLAHHLKTLLEAFVIYLLQSEKVTNNQYIWQGVQLTCRSS